MTGKLPPKIFQEFHEALENKKMKLTKFQPIDQFENQEIREALIYGYSSEDVLDNVIAVLMNATIASRKKTFLLSRSLLIEYFERDPNASNRNFSGEQLKRIIGLITEMKFIRRVSESSRKATGEKRAAVYEVIHPKVIEYINLPV